MEQQHMRIKNKIFSLFVLLIFSFSCSFTSSSSEFCDWFNKSQQIRAVRIPAILSVQNVYTKYGTDKLDYSNSHMVTDMTNAMKEYISINEDFIDQWNDLGYVQPGEHYWANELEAVQLFNDGFSKALEGMSSQDIDLINKGLKLYDQGNDASKKAETDMIKFNNDCN